MEKEFLGIGRTWFGVYILIAFTGAMVFTGHIQVSAFMQQSLLLLAIGGGKSGIEKIAKGFGKK